MMQADLQTGRLPPQARLLLGIISGFKPENGCYLRQSQLAERMGLSIKSVQRWLTVLERAGLIVKSRGGHTDARNTYRLADSNTTNTTLASPLNTTLASPLNTTLASPLNTTRALIDEESNSASASSDAAADEERADVKTIKALEQLGMPAVVRQIAEASASLALATLSHCRSRFAIGGRAKIVNPPGYIVACLRDPAGKMGFEIRDGRWQTPVEIGKVYAERGRARAVDAASERRAQTTEFEKERALAAERSRRWESRPDSVKEHVRHLIRTNEPLLWQNALRDPTHWTVTRRCIDLSEQLENDSKLPRE